MFNTRDFGAFITRKRKNLAMTQSNLADKLNLTRQAVSKYEVGDSFPDISTLINMAEIFDISLDELINSAKPTKGESVIIKGSIYNNEVKSSVEVDDLVNVAPLVKPSTLGKYASILLTQGIDISRIVTLVQYLNDDNILQLLKTTEFIDLNEDLAEKLIPFFR